MNTTQITLIVIVAIAALALIVFMIMRNKKDRKEIFPTDGSDAVEEEKIIQEQKRDRL